MDETTASAFVVLNKSELVTKSNEPRMRPSWSIRSARALVTKIRTTSQNSCFIRFAESRWNADQATACHSFRKRLRFEKTYNFLEPTPRSIPLTKNSHQRGDVENAELLRTTLII